MPWLRGCSTEGWQSFKTPQALLTPGEGRSDSWGWGCVGPTSQGWPEDRSLSIYEYRCWDPLVDAVVGLGPGNLHETQPPRTGLRANLSLQCGRWVPAGDAGPNLSGPLLRWGHVLVSEEISEETASGLPLSLASLDLRTSAQFDPHRGWLAAASGTHRVTRRLMGVRCPHAEPELCAQSSRTQLGTRCSRLVCSALATWKTCLGTLGPEDGSGRRSTEQHCRAPGRPCPVGVSWKATPDFGCAHGVSRPEGHCRHLVPHLHPHHPAPPSRGGCICTVLGLGQRLRERC